MQQATTAKEVYTVRWLKKELQMSFLCSVVVVVVVVVVLVVRGGGGVVSYSSQLTTKPVVWTLNNQVPP